MVLLLMVGGEQLLADEQLLQVLLAHPLALGLGDGRVRPERVHEELDLGDELAGPVLMKALQVVVGVADGVLDRGVHERVSVLEDGQVVDGALHGVVHVAAREGVQEVLQRLALGRHGPELSQPLEAVGGVHAVPACEVHADGEDCDIERGRGVGEQQAELALRVVVGEEAVRVVAVVEHGVEQAVQVAGQHHVVHHLGEAGGERLEVEQDVVVVWEDALDLLRGLEDQADVRLGRGLGGEEDLGASWVVGRASVGGAGILGVCYHSGVGAYLQ